MAFYDLPGLFLVCKVPSGLYEDRGLLFGRGRKVDGFAFAPVSCHDTSVDNFGEIKHHLALGFGTRICIAWRWPDLIPLNSSDARSSQDDLVALTRNLYILEYHTAGITK